MSVLRRDGCASLLGPARMFQEASDVPVRQVIRRIQVERRVSMRTNAMTASCVSMDASTSLVDTDANALSDFLHTSIGTSVWVSYSFISIGTSVWFRFWHIVKPFHGCVTNV